MDYGMEDISVKFIKDFLIVNKIVSLHAQKNQVGIKK